MHFEIKGSIFNKSAHSPGNGVVPSLYKKRWDSPIVVYFGVIL